MGKKAIGRADFFKYIFGKGAAAVSEFTEGITEPFQKAGDVADKMLHQTLLPVTEYHNEPRLLTSSKPPVYIVGEIDTNLTALPALCDADGFLLSYLPQESALYCSVCGAKHHITYGDEQVECSLKAIPLALREGFICFANT